MIQDHTFLIAVFTIAFLYASVGHGGASGYLALMVLFGINPVLMKSSALLLNIVVSAIAFIQYYRQGFFNRKLLIPFIILSIPLSFIGAKIHIDIGLYKIILAICLLLATMRILGLYGSKDNSQTSEINFILALFVGAVIGFISGMIGIGGGILLSPVLLLLHWADMKQIPATSAAFILLNSIAGIAGASMNAESFSPQIVEWVVIAIAGGALGSFYGSSRFNHVVLKYVLSLVLLFACTKLIIT